jgi:DNA (cytosine-5)-methyltransferase 1
MLKIGTVFSGIGAFEQALDKLNINYKTLFACDNDRFVKQSYFANYDIDESRWYNDVFDINGKKYQGKIDLFVGGSPCQSFSAIGFREGLKDKRGLLIFEFVRLVKEIQPQVFIFENVKGLLTHNKGET